MITLCRICDEPFNAKRVNQTICSHQCRQENRHIIYKRNYKGSYHKVSPTKKVCVICKSDFETNNNSQKCCGKECSNTNRLNISRKLYHDGRKSKQEEKKSPKKPVDNYWLVPGTISSNRISSPMGGA